MINNQVGQLTYTGVFNQGSAKASFFRVWGQQKLIFEKIVITNFHKKYENYYMSSSAKFRWQNIFAKA